MLLREIYNIIKINCVGIYALDTFFLRALLVLLCIPSWLLINKKYSVSILYQNILISSKKVSIAFLNTILPVETVMVTTWICNTLYIQTVSVFL